MSEHFLLILAGVALVTYLTRVGGYLVLARFRTIPPRVAAGLEAVPVAVMTTLFAPQIVSGTWREAAAMGFAVVLSLRFGATVTLLVATLAVVALRAV